MALNRTTTWICDVCLAEAVVKSTEDKTGVDEPYKWEYRNIHVSADSKREWVRKVLMCDGCLEGFLKLYSLKAEDKVEIKKSFWQKLLGRKDEKV